MSNLPQRIGNYNIERRIGKGGTSEVWLGRHRSLENRQVAIKLLLSQDQEWTTRFSLEAAITSRLRHDNIVQIFDHGYQAPYYYTVMEYVDGGALRDVLKTGQSLSLDQALHIFRCAGIALDYAHTNGVIHRDVSPGNILVETGTQRVLLTDFGIAREAGKAGVTTVNKIMGTPGYLSPEHASSARAVTHLSDIFSLGVVLFEMLSGRLPWDHNPGMPDQSGGLFTTPKTLRSCGVTSLPAEVDRVIQTMLAVDPTKRYPTAQLAIEDLERVLHRHTRPTQVVNAPGTAAAAGAAGSAEPARSLVVTQRSEPHPVETVLGPDLLKGPMQEARKHADVMSKPQEIAALLNRWSAQGRFRRRLLGRQAVLHHVTNTSVYFYTLHVLYETREPARLVREPDHKGVVIPLERELDRWGVQLPQPKQFADDPGGTIRLPGSMRVSDCEVCHGIARTPCARCKGKGRIVSVREVAPAPAVPAASAPAPSAPSAPGAPAAATAPPQPQKKEVLISCPDCSGSGGIECKACEGAGRLLEQKTTAWSRRATKLAAHDDLPQVDEKWLARVFEPSVVYREQQLGGLRPEWQAVPPVADLAKQARAGLDENQTRIALSELEVSFIPITEIVFDLGEQLAPARGNQSAPPVVNTYSMYIYGFKRMIPNDWRFLNWDRVWALLLSIGVGALLLLIVVLLLTSSR